MQVILRDFGDRRRLGVASNGDEPITLAGIRRLIDPAEVESVILKEPDLERKENASIEWLDELPGLFDLVIHGSRKSPIPRIPPTVLRRLGNLALVGDIEGRVAVDDLSGLEGLVVQPITAIDGPLSRCPVLRRVHVGQFAEPDLEVIAGCDQLIEARFECRRQEVAVRWTRPPASLENLSFDSAALSDLTGAESVSRLRTLSVWNATAVVLNRPLSLAPLASCRALERLSLNGLIPVSDVSELRALPSLEGVLLTAGAYDPVDAALLPVPVHEVRARRRRPKG